MGRFRIIAACGTIVLIIAAVTYYSLRTSVITSAIDSTGKVKAEIVQVGDGTLFGRIYRVRITIEGQQSIAPRCPMLDRFSESKIQKLRLRWLSNQDLQFFFDDSEETWRMQFLSI